MVRFAKVGALGLVPLVGCSGSSSDGTTSTTTDDPVVTTGPASSSSPPGGPSQEEAAARYLELVAPRNCVGDRLRASLASYGDGPMAADWTRVQAETLPLFAELAAAERDFQVALGEEAWPVAARDEVDALVGELTVSAHGANAVSEVDSLADFDRLVASPPPSGAADELRAVLGLPPDTNRLDDDCPGAAGRVGSGDEG